ncbi:MAG: DUF5615 family PIN-like protein [Nitrospirales bacterium]
MNILLDECAPQRLRTLVAGHEVITVPDAGLAGIQNGELLEKVAAMFDLLLTVDRDLAFQQDPSLLPIPVIALISTSTKFRDLAPLVPRLLQPLKTDLKKTVYRIGA